MIKATFSTIQGHPITMSAKTIEDLKLSIEEGKISATSESMIRKTADINALQEIYDMYGGKTTLTANEFLNLRKDLDSMAKWEQGKTNASTSTAKKIRGSIDEYGKNQLTGLKELDAKYAPMIKELQAIKGNIYDSKGKIKQSAYNLASNLLNKGNKGKLMKLEELTPGITEELKAIKAAENILNPAKGLGKITSTGRLGAFGWAAYTQNWPLMAGIIATSPTLLIPILKTFGKAKGILSETKVSGLITKIQDGISLTAKEAEEIVSTLNKISAHELVLAGIITQEEADKLIPTSDQSSL